MIDQRIFPGVMLFDDSMTLASGWACHAGEAPFRVEGTNELSSDSIWLTNLTFDEFKDSNLRRSNRYRSDGYLRTDLSSLSLQIGVADGRGESVGGFCAQVLAQLFGNVMSVATRFGVSSFPPDALRLGFRHALWRPAGVPTLDMKTSIAFQDACQAIVFSQRRKLKREQVYKTISVPLTRHRYQHAVDILSQPVPYGGWHTLPRMTQAEILEYPKPLLLEANVVRTDETLGSVLNFGGTGQAHYQRGGQAQIAATPRRWLTHPEYRLLSRHAEIAVHTILGAEAYQPNPLLQYLPDLGICQQISPAFLLAIESMWTCPLRNMRNAQDPTPITAWMLAYDRLLCLQEAMRLIQADPEIDIVSFSYGTIRVRIIDPEKKIGDRLWDIVQGTSLIPIMCVNGPCSTIGNLDESNPIELLQAIQCYGRPSVLLDNDQAALDEFDASGGLEQEAVTSA